MLWRAISIKAHEGISDECVSGNGSRCGFVTANDDDTRWETYEPLIAQRKSATRIKLSAKRAAVKIPQYFRSGYNRTN